MFFCVCTWGVGGSSEGGRRGQGVAGSRRARDGSPVVVASISPHVSRASAHGTRTGASDGPRCRGCLERQREGGRAGAPWLTAFGGDREHNSPSSWLKRRHVHVCPASVPALRGVLRAGRRCNIGEFGNATRPAPAEPEADSPAPPTPAVPPGPPTFRDASRHRGQLDAKLRTRILYNDTKKTNRATGAARSRSRSRGPRARRRRRRRRSGRGTAVARRRPARA